MKKYRTVACVIIMVIAAIAGFFIGATLDIFLPEVRLPVASASPGKAFCIRQNLVTFWTIRHRCLTTQQVLANLSNTRGVPTAG